MVKKLYLLSVVMMLAVCACLPVGKAHAQTTVSGTVMTEQNEAIIGANIVVKGTANGTVSDINGEFRLQISGDVTNPTLVVSSIGYVTKEILVAAQTVFNITLAEDTKVLSEVVVTGYTSQRKDKITGAVAVVKPEELIKLPVPTVDQALQGRAAGVVVSQNTGAPGEGVSVRIRGVGSVLSGNSPLYVVDGLPTLDISNLSTQDMQSMTVLKDAAAAAVYGSRAGNGVVIITTKSGSNAGPVVSVSSQVGFQQPSRKIKMANTEQYVQIFNEAMTNDNAFKDNPIFKRPLITEDIASTLADTDWIDEIMRDGVLQSHGVSVSGGNDKTRYFIAGNYFGQQGIVKGSNFDRLSGRVNVDSDVKSWLKVGVNLNISKANTDLIGSSGDGAGGNGGSVIRYAYFRTPAIPVYDQNGDFTDKPDRFELFGDGYNPVGMLAYNQNHRIEDRLFGKFYINVEPLPGLKFISNFGMDYSNVNQRRFNRMWGTDNRINGINSLAILSETHQTITWSNFASYTKAFDDHSFSVLLGEETIKGDHYGIYPSQMNFPDQEESLVFLGNGVGLLLSPERKWGNALASFFGKVDYDFQGKYLVSATIRRDGSSRFGPENRWGTFYAGSLGWRIDQEFFKDNASVERWLLRAGYGSIGNQEIGDYGYASQIGLSAFYPYGNTRTLGSSIATYGNSKIKWETSKQFNVGTDIELWGGKLTASVDYFRKETVDLLVRQPLAASVGLKDIAYAYANNGNVLNTGFEVQLGHENSLGDFRYSIVANAATLTNEVTKLDARMAAGSYGSSSITMTEVGHPVGSFYMYDMEGIFQNPLEIFTHAVPLQNLKPGDVAYRDVNRDGVIDTNDQTHVGTSIPKVTGALNLSMSYKGWDLSLFFQGAFGNKIFSVLNRDIEGFYRAFNVTERYFKGHWTGEGSTNKYPRASWDASNNNTMLSTRFLEDASYVRLKNLQIGYNLPKAFVSRYGFNTFRVYVTGTNLVTFTKYSGADPEMTVSDNDRRSADLANGIDWGTYPAARSYNVGINVSF